MSDSGYSLRSSERFKKVKKAAIALRFSGWPDREIAKILRVSTRSLSRWSEELEQREEEIRDSEKDFRKVMDRE